MKAIYLVGSIIFTVLIFILAFENSAIQIDLRIFQYSINSSPLTIIFIIAILGIFTGALYHAFIVRILKSPDDKDKL